MPGVTVKVQERYLMNYEQFICAFLSCVNEKLPETVKVERQTVLKNNGTKMEGIVLRSEDEKIVPIIYLESYYERYCQGTALEELAEHLCRNKNRKPAIEDWDYQSFLEFQKIKDRIVFKLINRKKNEKVLSQVPHLEFMDLAVVFQVAVPGGEEDHCSVLIRNSHMEMWQTSIVCLYECARKNTPQIYPSVFCALSDFMNAMGFGEIEKSPLHILTNRKGVNGASVLLYPEIMTRIYQQFDGSYYLLPSSIHEFLLLKEDENSDPEQFLSVVRSANKTEIHPEDYLSDHIYHFDGDNITKM